MNPGSVGVEVEERVPLWELPSEEDCGLLEVSCEDGRESRASRCRASYPLKLLLPRLPLPSSAPYVPIWAYAITFGGGLLAGDRVGLRVDVKAGATCVITNQASTKVYKRSRSTTCLAAKRGPAGQKMCSRVGQGALLALLPEPLCCYKDSSYEQDQVFELEKGGSLVLLDWFTSGRRAQGEIWHFSQFRSLNAIRVDGKPLLHDHVLLANGGLTTVAERMGRAHVSAVLVLVGPRVADVAQKLLRHVMPPLVRECFRRTRPSVRASGPPNNDSSRMSVTHSPLDGVEAKAVVSNPPPFFFASASPLGESGDAVIIRMAAESSDEAYVFVRECLRPLQDQIGQLPFPGC